MPTPSPTVDELISTLKKTNIPTILVEGDDDVIVYRRIEQIIGSTTASILPCGGRDPLLKIYQRRNEFSHLVTAFVADKDMWVFTTIPTEFSDVIFTEGYCIENDLYAGANLERLFDETQKKRHSQILLNIINWFAFEVENFLKTGKANVKKHLQAILVHEGVTIKEDVLTEIGFTLPDKDLVDDISRDYKMKLRGKFLFQLFCICSHKDRVRYTVPQTIDICLNYQDTHKYIDNLTLKIKDKLGM